MLLTRDFVGGCIAVQMPGSTTSGNSTTGNTNTNTTGRKGSNRNQRFQRLKDISSYHLKREIKRLVRRLSISPSEANDLITAAGSALNIPIDLLVSV